MQADTRVAEIAILFSHPDVVLQQLYFEELQKMQLMLEEATGEHWNFAPLSTDANGKSISKAYMQLTSVNVFDKADWPAIISFFKPRIIALDAFWSTAKDVIEML